MERFAHNFSCPPRRGDRHLKAVIWGLLREMERKEGCWQRTDPSPRTA